MSEEARGPALRAVPGAPSDEDTDPIDGLTPPRGRARSIPEAIVELGFAERERVEQAIERGRGEGKSAGELLCEEEVITSDQLARATAQRFGLWHVDLSVYKTDLAALNLISSQAARRLSAAPIGFDDDGRLRVAIHDPSNVIALDDLKLMTGHEVQTVVASGDDIQGLIGRMSRLDEAVAEAVEEGEAELADVTEIRESADDAPVIKLVNSIIAQAVEELASDIHFEPDGRDMRVRFRVDGVLRETTTIPRRMVAGVVSRVKIMADLDIAEKRVPQDGRVSLTVDGHAIDTRVVTMPRVDGEGIVLRILDKSAALIGLDQLGMSEQCAAAFEAGFRRAHGAVLATGPTGSGKSTTLYGALNAINDIERNIITIEDPVEYQLAGINQLQMNLKAGLTFASGLKAMLRADPDVIMVGEIRDGETAKIAIESALTGHLVLSTLHTNDAPSAITRLTEMGIEPFLTASALCTVVAQRLVRRLCTHCKRQTTLSVSSLERAGFSVAFDLDAYEPVGCGRCGHSGYKGRTGLYEVMSITDEIRDLTVERAPAEEIRKIAVAQGMRPLRADGFEKVKNGITSIAEVARVT
ncbi:MAG TPA: ATPase, T2SS/T4P/T4SS family [Thermoleophilaceae bacterium]|jgi:type IV pilus assembly protein PilB|nr:ATPase, T2SS/T4P/T4SS family [Thermoleophilaceae bacterium]